jgi:hypothetical protein
VVGALAVVDRGSSDRADTGRSRGDSWGLLWWEPLQWEPMWVTSGFRHRGASRKTVGVPVVGALAVVVWVPVTELTLGDPGVTVGVPVVSATAMGANVGAPVAGNTGASRSHYGCSCGGCTGCGCGVLVTGLTMGDPGVTVGVPVVEATELETNVGQPVAGDTKGLPGFTVGVPVVRALAVVVGVPVIGLIQGDPAVTVGVPVVGATELGAIVGAPVAGDTKGLPGVTVGVPVVEALAVVVGD